MNENNIKWIPCNGIDLNPVNVSTLEKVKKFGFSLMLNEFGLGKISKLELCIYDLISRKEKPNILLICPSHETYGWYRILMTGIGVDFKIISNSSNSISYFFEEFSNMFIISKESLKKQNGIQDEIPSSFVWDMVIIDEEQGCNGESLDIYIKNIKNAAESFIFISSKPAEREEDYEKIRELVKKVMNNPMQSVTVDDIVFDNNLAKFNSNSPISRCFNEMVYTGELKRNIIVEHYKFDDDILEGLRRKVDLRTGMPLYIYGGNIFEEYDCELKSVYNKSYYGSTDVEELRLFDKKLDACLAKLDLILEDPKNRAIIYCVDNKTIDYLGKILRARYGRNDGILKLSKGEIFDTNDVLRKLRVDDKTTYARIILAIDVLSAVGDGLDRITHIINYELPVNAAVLEQRMTRHGAAKESEREFIIFVDDNNMFDSRILTKVLCGNICSGLLPMVPSRNILFDIPDLAEKIADVLLDLSYINSYSTEVDNCFDLIKKFNGDYNVREFKIENSKQLSEYSSNKLHKIKTAFEIEDIKNENKTVLCEQISKKLIEYKDSLLYLGENGAICSISGYELKELMFNDDYEAATNCDYIKESKAGIEEAKEYIHEMHDNEFFISNIKQSISNLPESVKFSVIYGIWRFRVRERGSQKSFAQFIKIYNDGV